MSYELATVACMEEVREILAGFSFLFCSYGYQELSEDGQACAAGTLTD